MSAPPGSKTLGNAKHERFAQAVVSGRSFNEAYAEVGYVLNPSHARRLGANPTVKERVAWLLEKAAEKAVISASRVLEELAKIGFANIADFTKVMPNGDLVTDFSKITPDELAAVAEITVEEYKDGRGFGARDVKRTKVKLNDKRAALVDIGKHLGMFKDLVEHTGKDGAPIEVHEISDEEAARRMLFVIAKARKQRGQTIQ